MRLRLYVGAGARRFIYGHRLSSTARPRLIALYSKCLDAYLICAFPPSVS